MAFKEVKTEKVLLGAIVALVLAFLVNAAVSGTFSGQKSLAEETSGGDNETSSDNEGSGEESQDADEESTDEASAPSVPSQTRTQTQTQLQQQSVQSADELSVEEASEAGEVSETEETSEPSAPSEPSVTSVEGYDRVVSTEGNVAVVEKDEKLFFLVPVTTESQVTLDGQGNVVDAQQSFVNWLLSLFSF